MVRFKIAITNIITKNSKVKNTIFLFLGNNTNIDRIMLSKVPNDNVITVTMEVTVNEMSSKIFLNNTSVLGRRCIDRRSANILTKPMIPIGVS